MKREEIKKQHKQKPREYLQRQRRPHSRLKYRSHHITHTMRQGVYINRCDLQIQQVPTIIYTLDVKCLELS